MAETAAGTYANLAGTEIVNNARVLAYLRNGLGPGSVRVYGDCSCENMFELLGCHPAEVELDQYVDLPGTTGNFISTPDTPANSLQGTDQALQLGSITSSYVSTPDSAALSITGDIDIRAEVQPDIWNSDLIQQVVASDVGDPNRRIRFYITPAGGLGIDWFPTGSIASLIAKTSTVTTGFAAGLKRWVRVTLDVDNGAAGNTVRFYTSTDGTIWTQLGADVVTAGVTSLADTTGQYEIGTRFNGFNGDGFRGRIYKAVIKNGINGITVADPDFTTTPWAIGNQSPTAKTDSLGNVWTLNGNAEIVALAERRSLRLSGAAGTFASTPDAAALDIVSDIDIRVLAALDDWTPAGPNTLVSKWNDVGANSYIFRVNTAGTLQLIISQDGTASITATSTIANTISDGALSWVRATWNNTTDQANFYTSVDGVTWNQLGAANVALVATGIFSSNAALTIGAQLNVGSVNRLTGNVFYAEVRNGINGTVVASPDFRKRPWDVGETGGATGTDANGNVWTLNGAGAVIQRAFASDLDIRVKATMDDWTPASTGTLISKRTDSGNQKSWAFRLLSTGVLNVILDADGSTDKQSSSSVGTGFTDGQAGWVRFTFASATGQVLFYTSTDGSSWSQLGSTPTALGAFRLFDGTAPVNIGAYNTGLTSLLSGYNVHYAEVRNGIEGSITGSTIVAQFDANEVPATSATTPNTVPDGETGAIWTINGAGWVWGNGAYTFPFFPFVAPNEYSSPLLDNAPWVSSDIPESVDFLGFLVDEFEGMDSPFTREVRQSIGNGGVLTRSRLGTRSMTWRGFLFGATCCATQYGLRWLTKTLARFDTNCRDCFGDDLELMVCCPSTGESVEAFRTIKGVGLLEGPTIESERATCSGKCGQGGCGKSCILEVEFTLVATQPYFYQAPIPVYECVPLTGLDTNNVADLPTSPDCLPDNCGTSLEVNCGTELPPAPVYENSCFNPVIGALGFSQYFTVPNDLWPFLSEVVPVITITNNSAFTYDGLKIGFYTSLSGDPCGELFTNPPGCAALCDELVIGYLPGQSSFYIDGRTRKMSLICFNSDTAFPGEKHTQGPWSWPVFSEFGFCMEVQTTLDSPLTPDICVSISLVPRTF